ncbi:hypothetical protein GCM10011504_55020 [Siccirubricoccus deserti]|nr:ATP-binding protein [Siccirubricoccus deserti]GGC70209.1 hypothetical protein GCM10011504_55020 [Siccirubricoccus deserti]
MIAPDDGNSEQGDADIRLVNALADPASRHAAAAALARHWGVDAVLVLVRDHELGVLRPAPGFPQTLPGGPTWRDLFARCGTSNAVTGTVAFPDRHSLVPFSALMGADGNAALVLLGGEAASAPLQELDRIGFPLLAALLHAESTAIVSAGLAAEARNALARAASLASALDAARSELARSLAEADRLNRALRELNTTLEERVAERTRQLEAEMAQRREVEAALAQAQKMEALGHLTGGVAHDFNNLLTGVSGSLALMRRRIEQGRVGEIGRYIDTAAAAAGRAAVLTHRLLAFSRRQPLEPKPVDLNRLVAGITELLHRSLGETIELEGVLAARLWRVEVDAGQMENALLNLAVNARDAMPDGGKLTIETRNTYLDEAYAKAFSEVRPGQYIEVSVSDTGYGMPPEVADRVFEPFFTTKPIGQGTGLGLSQVYGFVKQSSGHVRIYSEVGRGTTIKVYLPRFHGEDAPEDTPDRQAALGGSAGETVLVVEDEAVVRAFSCEVLRELGYQVLEAGDAEAALRLLAQEERVDLLFTDVVLPGGRTGRELAEEAVRRVPGIKVLYTTGYARNAIVHHGRLDPGVRLLTKPFTFEDLATQVRDALDGSA